ncbi:larval cuticle protein 65Ag1 [Hyalella azteca]|uniref:Larval cuticle protein 65Ag1 n=1 Tax=Hyalella azteca TaxID=294128 RepID=A0A8B7PPY1_HYAAZ|nr:larval cuticle protein 65Ag1 [Hyalella azteca]
MKYAIFIALFAVASALPGRVVRSSDDVVPILRSDVVAPSAGGEYSFDVETGDGIVRSESGYGSADNGAVESQGTVSFTHPDGTPFELKFVANAAGYQPESAALPVAPAFPFEIPQFVLDQIAKAAEEDANRSLEQSKGDYVGYE